MYFSKHKEKILVAILVACVIVVSYIDTPIEHKDEIYLEKGF